jgi:hypothetical protein
MESQKDDVQMRFDDFTTFISNKDPNTNCISLMRVV